MEMDSGLDDGVNNLRALQPRETDPVCFHLSSQHFKYWLAEFEAPTAG